MNKFMKMSICVTMGCCLLASSCSDLTFGDKFLGDQPESSGADIELMFSSKNNADKVLNKAYTGLLYGITTNSEARLGGNVLEALTDLCHSFRNNAGDGPTVLYYNGELSPNTVSNISAYLYGGLSDWTTIRYAWLYLENVSKVPDMTGSEVKERCAEAKMLIALSYFRMMRYVGGVTWLDHAVNINETMQYPRLTFEETINRIVSLLDEAIPDLKWKQSSLDDGRMSKAGAMALKFQVLLWAASPTFNSDSKWHSEADEYTCYGNYSKQRWERARQAAVDFFDELNNSGGYELIQPEEQTHQSRRLAYRKAYYDRGGTEVLISIRKGYDVSLHQSYFNQSLYTGPTLNYVEMFPWEDGTDFPNDFDWKNPSREPFFDYSEENGMVPTRDPRLYENVACPGDVWLNGTAAPVYTNHAEYRTITGFLMMKFILQEAGDRANRPVQWPYLRLPEIMLGYAEVLNELNAGPVQLAYDQVNAVRKRVGLGSLPSNLDQKKFREALLKERALELGFEEVHWFDLVRHNQHEAFTKQLYGLKSKGNDLNNPTAFTFEKVKLDVTRFWVGNWDTKWYLAPIPQNEINKNYGMTQNPGW